MNDAQQTTNESKSSGYIAPLRKLKAKPKPGDTFEAFGSASLFDSDRTPDTLTVVDVDERESTPRPGYGDEDRKTYYVVTIEKPSGERFESQDWESNLNWKNAA